MIGEEGDLIWMDVRRDEDLGMYEVFIQLGGETHYETEAVARLALGEYAEAMEHAATGHLPGDVGPDYSAAAERKAGYDMAIAALRQIAKEPGSELGDIAANWLDVSSTRARALESEPPQPMSACPKCRQQQLLVDREPGGPEAVCLLCFWEKHADKPFLLEPARCIVIPRPERHVSTVKIAKNTHMVKFCVPCKVYTTISVCPCCNTPTLGAGRPPGEDAGVRARREQEAQARRWATPTLKAKHGTVSETPEGPVIDVDAVEVRKAADFTGHATTATVEAYDDPRPATGDMADAEDCRRCSECEHQVHHWEIDVVEAEEEEEGDETMVWGCKHCDTQFPILSNVPEVDYAIHTGAQPEMLPARVVAAMVAGLADADTRTAMGGSEALDVCIQLRVSDDSWHSIERVEEYDRDHLLFLIGEGRPGRTAASPRRYDYGRRHKNEHMSWRVICPPCDCDEPDGECEGCDDPHGHTCRACDEEWCQACWLRSAHAETCPPATREERAG